MREHKVLLELQELPRTQELRVRKEIQELKEFKE
jgi:hypothetical protein